jgi:hypothetical protein
MKRVFLVSSIIVLFYSTSIFAQSSSPQQWEYKEVSTNFIEELNVLGKNGWELVSFFKLESYGNSYIFKRPYIAERTKKENDEIREKEKLLQSQLIDLDKVEAQSVQKENERKANEKIETAIRKIKGFSIVSIKVFSWLPTEENRRISAEVIIDASKELLKDGNKYRSSEADKLIKQIALDVYKLLELKPKYAGQEPFINQEYSNESGVQIKLSVGVNFNGTLKILTQGIIQGDWEKSQYP